MPEILKIALSKISAAAVSPAAFAAYTFALVAYIIIFYRQSRLKKLEKIPAKSRLEALKLDWGVVLPDSITAEEWMKERRQRYIFIGFLVLIALISFIGVIAFAFPKETAEVNEATVLVKPDDFASVFGSDLMIKVEQVKPEGDPPLRYRVTATVSSPLYPIQKIVEEGEGYHITYPDSVKFQAAIRYEILIIDVNSSFARFRVERKLTGKNH